MQNTFFDEFDKQRLWRKSDPDTSREGAAATNLNAHQRLFLDRLEQLGQATANEVAEGCESVRKRASELVRSGDIQVIGIRAFKVTGRRASVYTLRQPSRKCARTRARLLAGVAND